MDYYPRKRGRVEQARNYRFFISTFGHMVVSEEMSRVINFTLILIFMALFVIGLLCILVSIPMISLATRYDKRRLLRRSHLLRNIGYILGAIGLFGGVLYSSLVLHTCPN